MNKKLLFAVAGIVILIAGAVLYVLLTPETTSEPVETNTENNNAKAEPAASNENQVNPGVYTEYSEQAVLATSGTKVLFFHAPWCQQCREMEASINKDGIPSGVTVFKVDYDSNQTLRAKYGVTIQTTFVKVDDEGNKIESYVAYEEPQFSSVERELLK